MTTSDSSKSAPGGAARRRVRAPREGADETDQRFVNSQLQRRPDVGAVLLGYRDRTVEQRVPAGGEGIRAEQTPEHTEPHRVVQRGLEIEFRETPGVGAPGVEHPERGTVEAEAPAEASRDAVTDGVSPRARRLAAPVRDQQGGRGRAVRLEDRMEQPARAGAGERHAEPQRRAERCGDPIEDRAGAERRPHLAGDRRVPGTQPAMGRRGFRFGCTRRRPAPADKAS